MVVPLSGDSLNHDRSYNAGVDSVISVSDPKQKNAEDIELAVKNIERFIVSDNSFPELADKLKIRQGLLRFLKLLHLYKRDYVRANLTHKNK